jgi:hypothetical protein
VPAPIAIARSTATLYPSLSTDDRGARRNVKVWQNRPPDVTGNTANGFLRDEPRAASSGTAWLFVVYFVVYLDCFDRVPKK